MSGSSVSRSSSQQPQAVKREQAIQAIREAFRLALYQSSQSLLGYLHHVVIDSRPEPKSYRLIAEPWQWFLMKNIAPAIEAVCGFPSQKNYSGPRRFLFVLPRGHDKTSSIGRILNWALGFNKRKISAIAAAGDKDQASRLADFMKTESGLNPWLDDRIDHHNYVVRGYNDAKLQIVSADANSSFGDKSDIVICDELTHWPNEDLWSALYSGSEKRPDSVYIIITNAGIQGSWQHDLLIRSRSKPNDWFVFEAPGPISKYMSPEKTEQLANELPKGVGDRVIRNKWLDPSEGMGYLTRDEMQGCFDLGVKMGTIRTLKLPAMDKGQKHSCVASIDYGSVKDRCVMVVGHRLDLEVSDPLDGVIVIDRMDVFQGTPTDRVKVTAVEEWIEDIEQDFDHPLFVVDPYQMEGTIQRYEAEGFRIERFSPRGGKSNYEMAISLHNQVTQHKLALYPGCGTIVTKSRGIGAGLIEHTVVDEVAELVVKLTNYGFRFDHESGKNDDRAVALGMLTLTMSKQPRKKRVVWDDAIYF